MKKFVVFAILVLYCFLLSCSDSGTETPTLFEFNQRVSNSFFITNSIESFSIENPIGYVTVSGTSDSIEIGYVLDKTVKVTESSLSQTAFDEIELDQNVVGNVQKCKVQFPSNNESLYKSNLHLNIPYDKSVEVKNTEGGIMFSDLNSYVKAETDDYGCTIYHHSGSLEAKSISGKISGSIDIPIEGFCKCYSESGEIHIQIPKNSSANILLKTINGNVTYFNLDLEITSSTNKELKAKIGLGESTIDIESIRGNIILEGI